MKKLFFLLMTVSSSLSAIAQSPTPRVHRDSSLSRWVIDVNLLGGGASQTFTTANSSGNYPNVLNANTGQLTYQNGYGFGADAQLGYFFGKKRHFGIGTGFMYMEQHGDAVLNNYHVEYQATDGNANIFRQVVTGNNIKENIVARSYNIPVLLKYKDRFSKHWGFTADAGAVINLQTQNAYTTHASFDYEAIYKFGETDGIQRSVYDNSPTPDATDWLITKAEFLKNNPNGDVAAYFAAKRALGYSVGDGVSPDTRTGTTTYTQVTVGFLVQPSVNYFLSDHVALNLGVYYMIQPFTNNAQTGYQLTDGVGKYSSVMNNVTAATDQSYGINFGARFFLGHSRKPMTISSIDESSPSQCGFCDGSMAFHGLTPNKKVTINYSVNGAPNTSYTTVVETDGQVKMTHLCAGSYTGIEAKIKRHKATAAPVTIAAANMTLATQDATNPTSVNECNGSVMFTGVYANDGKVTVSYSVDGTHKTYAGSINPDHSISIRGLCPGNYSGITVQVNDCSANGTDFILTAPIPAPLPPAAPVIDAVDISIPILFDVNKTIVPASSYPLIDEAAKELNANTNARLTIDGHADASGSEPSNKILSLKRANAVKAQLTKRGVSANKVKTRGHGSSMPAATNATREGKRENRRAIMKMEPAQ